MPEADITPTIKAVNLMLLEAIRGKVKKIALGALAEGESPSSESDDEAWAWKLTEHGWESFDFPFPEERDRVFRRLMVMANLDYWKKEPSKGVIELRVSTTPYDVDVEVAADPVRGSMLLTFMYRGEGQQ